MNVTTLVLAATIAVAFPRLAFADKKAEVQKHLTTAYAAYKEQRWQDVLDALRKAYALDPKPELHYSMGQVYMKMGRCGDAVRSYGKYLASNPVTSNANVAREAIDGCKAAAPPPTDPAPPVKQTVDETPRTLPGPPKETPRGGGRDKLGLTLLGGGGAILLAGAGVYLLARADLHDAERAPTYGEQVDLFDKASTKQLISVALAIGGGVVVGAGIVHYLRKKPREQRGIGLAPTRNGGFVTWIADF
jgi:tetratricopeptide (TPR) repeat protein